MHRTRNGSLRIRIQNSNFVHTLLCITEIIYPHTVVGSEPSQCNALLFLTTPRPFPLHLLYPGFRTPMNLLILDSSDFPAIHLNIVLEDSFLRFFDLPPPPPPPALITNIGGLCGPGLRRLGGGPGLGGPPFQFAGGGRGRGGPGLGGSPFQFAVAGGSGGGGPPL